MGIDINAVLRGGPDKALTDPEQRRLGEVGKRGYVRECYHGAPYATEYLFAEAFNEWCCARIPAHVLRDRLPRALELVEERHRKIYDAEADEIAAAQKDFSDFVALCEREEEETGEPVLILASY